MKTTFKALTTSAALAAFLVAGAPIAQASQNAANALKAKPVKAGEDAKKKKKGDKEAHCGAEKKGDKGEKHCGGDKGDKGDKKGEDKE